MSPLGSGCFGGAGPPKACAKATSVLYVHCVADPTQLSVKWCRARTLRGQRSGPRDQAGPRGVPWHTNMFQRCPLRGYRYHPSSQRGGDIPLAGGGGLGASLVQRSKACPLAHCARGQNGFSRELGQSLPSGGPPGAPKPPHVFSRGGCAPINSPTTFWGGPRPPPKGCFGGASACRGPPKTTFYLVFETPPILFVGFVPVVLLPERSTLVGLNSPNL